jgi:peroxiredoxin
MTNVRSRLAAILALTIGVGAGVVAQEQKPAAQAPPEKATVDKPVKTFALKDIAKELKEGEKEDAAIVDTAKLKDKKAAVLFFMSEKCSVTWRYEKRIGELMKDLEKKDVAFYAVRCSAADTTEGIKKFAETRNFDMPILNDEKGEMTKFYGVRQTPTFVVVDKKGVLRFKGGFDDSPDESGVKQAYVKNAVTAVLDGKDVAVKEARVFG